MARIRCSNVGIRAINACVPKQKKRTQEFSSILSAEAIADIEHTVGIAERRIAGADICTSDLCYTAAAQLLHDNGIEPQSIDMLLFMSQTGDYKIPMTSTLLQDRLGLPKSCACLDLVNACSGFVYALSTAYSYASMEGIDRVLLLTGDTLSKLLSTSDTVSAPVFGDAGTAVLVEKGSYGSSYFELGSSGRDYESIIIRAENGGRNPITQDSLQERDAGDGIMRSGLQLKMEGMDVFSFAITTVPKSIRALYEYSGTTDADVDLYLLHQANRYILDIVAKKLKTAREKIPTNLGLYGNTSSASIPLLLCTEFEHTKLSKRCVLCGFGAGLSWASAYLRLTDCAIGTLAELS